MGPASCDDPKHAELLSVVERLIVENRQQSEQIKALTETVKAQARTIDAQAKRIRPADPTLPDAAVG